MKVYSLPDELPVPEPDYRNYDHAREAARNQEHCAAVKAWLIEAGYAGKRTGEVVRFPVADGYAEYMLAEGSKSFLVHLPYGDGYHYREVQYLPKAEILRRLAQQNNLSALFAQAKSKG